MRKLRGAFSGLEAPLPPCHTPLHFRMSLPGMVWCPGGRSGFRTERGHTLVTAGGRVRADCIARDKIVKCVSSCNFTIFRTSQRRGKGERSLHTGEVQGSIPCAPTSLRSRCELRLGKPPNYLASEGCRAEALGEGGHQKPQIGAFCFLTGSKQQRDKAT